MFAAQSNRAALEKVQISKRMQCLKPQFIAQQIRSFPGGRISLGLVQAEGEQTPGNFLHEAVCARIFAPEYCAITFRLMGQNARFGCLIRFHRSMPVQMIRSDIKDGCNVRRSMHQLQLKTR